MSRVAGVDLGGTNVTAVLLDGDDVIVDRARRKTPEDGPEAVVAQIVKAVGKLDKKPKALGVGAPGPIHDGVVMTAPNLVGWQEPFDLAGALREALEIPVSVDNDATVGALGEWTAGAGRGARCLLGAWVGTGVGGGLVLDGRPYRGAFGGAGEFGHMIVHRGGALCGCGRRGCVEAYAGRAALEGAAVTAVQAGRPTAMLEIQERLGKRRMTSAVWATALEEGDALARRLFDDAIDALGCGLSAAINLLDLDTVVLGGGLAEKLGDAFVEAVSEATRPRVLTGADERRFLLAELGDDAGAIGAAALARESLD
ncbi:MAG: ROK family protein [Actinomycetota bacterium]